MIKKRTRSFKKSTNTTQSPPSPDDKYHKQEQSNSSESVDKIVGDQEKSTITPTLTKSSNEHPNSGVNKLEGSVEDKLTVQKKLEMGNFDMKTNDLEKDEDCTDTFSDKKRFKEKSRA